MTDRAVYTPLRFSLVWLVGTFALFLLVGEVSRVPDMFKLVAFISATVCAFTAGYVLKAKTWREGSMPEAESRAEAAAARKWVLVSAIFTGVFGLAFLSAYGATGLDQVAGALLNPGEAYFFRLRDATLDTGNGVVQALTLGAALTTPLVPFLILFWERLTLALRLSAFVAIALYCSYWIYIGTQKGIGDFAVFAAVAMLARGALGGRTTSRRTRVVLFAIALVFALYMVFSQSDRLSSENTTGGIEPNPLVSAIAGDNIGRGVTTTLFYPTHGYLGLAQNLETEFEWTEGRGSSRSFDSYWTQYVGGETAFYDSYPARTERQTGWPALTYWATIYPWIASDLTWLGAIAIMGVVGWWLARWWLEAIVLRRKLALLLVCQLGILIAYVPANNQIGITRPGLVAFVTLLAVYTVATFSGRNRRVVYPRPILAREAGPDGS